MDLANLKPENDTITINIVHPQTYEPLENDDGSEMTITVYAPHTKEYKKVQHEQTNRRLKQAQKNKGKVELTAEDIEDATLEVMAKTTVEWNITYGGEKPELTVAKAKSIYDEVFWIREQIEEGVQDSLNFTKG